MIISDSISNLWYSSQELKNWPGSFLGLLWSLRRGEAPRHVLMYAVYWGATTFTFNSEAHYNCCKEVVEHFHFLQNMNSGTTYNSEVDRKGCPVCTNEEEHQNFLTEVVHHFHFLQNMNSGTTYNSEVDRKGCPVCNSNEEEHQNFLTEVVHQFHFLRNKSE